jgi:hypothetical protein
MGEAHVGEAVTAFYLINRMFLPMCPTAHKAISSVPNRRMFRSRRLPLGRSEGPTNLPRRGIIPTPWGRHSLNLIGCPVSRLFAGTDVPVIRLKKQKNEK